jgi:hypothetical protein
LLIQYPLCSGSGRPEAPGASLGKLFQDIG